MSTEKKLHAVEAVASEEDVAEFVIEESFLFDEFFEGENDKGIEVPIRIAGRMVPMTLKRGLSNADRAAAEMACIKKQVMPNGQIKMLGMDEQRLSEELVVRGILKWPFTHTDGSMVPVTRANLGKLKGGADAIMMALSQFDAEGEKALAPFSSGTA